MKSKNQLTKMELSMMIRLVNIEINDTLQQQLDCNRNSPLFNLLTLKVANLQTILEKLTN